MSDLETIESVILNQTHPGVEREEAMLAHAQQYASEILVEGFLTDQAWKRYLSKVRETLDIHTYGNTDDAIISTVSER
jgi:hypothetical protein